jgi:hypothetical protein
VAGRRLAGFQDVGHIGFLGAVERSGDADDHHIGFRQRLGLDEGGMETENHCPGKPFRGDVVDIAFSSVEQFRPLGVFLQASYSETLLRESQGQGQADIAKADDGYLSLSPFNGLKHPFHFIHQ